MKKIFTFILMLPFLLSSVSCEDKVDKDVTWPEWASRPIIEDMSVTAPTSEILAGETVNFTARIHDEFNDLKSYSLQVKYGNNIVFTKEEALEGNTAVIDMDIVMPFAANIDAGGFYPEISLTVVNVENGTATKRVSNDSNVSVLRPASPAKLYLVDNTGKTFELSKGEGYVYSTSSQDLAGIGESFYIAVKLDGTSPDFSDYVWGSVDGNTAIVSAGGESIRTPDSAGKGFKSFGFDTYSFEIEKLVNYSVTLDKNEMPTQEQGGVTYLTKENVELIRDCEIIFEGFDDLKSMLQPDRFQPLSANTAKFTGHTQNWSIYYDTNDNWLIVDYAINNTSGQLWVTGTKACFPLGNDETVNELNYLKGDGKDRYATLAAVRDDNGDFSILVYLKEGFALQLFRWIKWSTTVNMTSLTPEYASVTDDSIYIMQGTDFIPGVYMLEVHITEEANANGDGTAADISLSPYILE